MNAEEKIVVWVALRFQSSGNRLSKMSRKIAMAAWSAKPEELPSTRQQRNWAVLEALFAWITPLIHVNAC